MAYLVFDSNMTPFNDYVYFLMTMKLRWSSPRLKKLKPL